MRVKDGVEVEIKIVSVLKIGVGKSRHVENKENRVVETENFVFKVDEKRRDIEE